MEAIKLKNLSRTERHQRAAEDEEAFKEAEQARKAIDTQTRVQTRKKKAETDKRRKELEYVVLLISNSCFRKLFFFRSTF